MQVPDSSIVGAAVVGGLGAVAAMFAQVDWTQIIVGAVAAVGMILAALANSRGKKQETKTLEIGVNIDANNALIDQLQETIKAQSEEIDRYRSRLADAENSHRE